MIIIDADKFLAYLIFSKHIDGLTCGEVKEAVEMCKVDVIEDIKSEIKKVGYAKDEYGNIRSDVLSVWQVLKIIEKHTSGGDTNADSN